MLHDGRSCGWSYIGEPELSPVSYPARGRTPAWPGCTSVSLCPKSFLQGHIDLLHLHTNAGMMACLVSLGAFTRLASLHPRVRLK